MLKGGVELTGLRPEMAIAYTITTGVFSEHGYPCIITSAVDGTHSSNSKHYEGLALDLRSKVITTNREKGEILTQLKHSLPGFDVLLEMVGGPNEHFHIEYDPEPKPKPQVIA